MCPDLFLEEASCGSILVSNHQVFAFWMVAYGRFDCNSIYVSVNVFSMTVLIDDTVFTCSENGTTISAWSSEPREG